MEFQEFCKEYKRMCLSNKCKDCPLNDLAHLTDTCEVSVIAYPQRAYAIVEQWSKEHPIVRNCDKLHEVFGNGFKMMMRDTFDVFISRNGKEIPMSEWMYQEYKGPKEDDNGND